MDEQKLIKLLKENFPTKEEFSLLKNEVSGLKNVFVTKNDHNSLHNEMLEFKTETHQSFYDIGVQLKDIKTELKEIKEEIGELKPSTKSLDEILVQYPIERIERLEKHSKLPTFVPALAD